MVKGTATTRPVFQSRKDPPSKASNTACPPRSTGITVETKPHRRISQAKLGRGVIMPGRQAAHPHLENVDSNVGVPASSTSKTPCASPLRSKPTHSLQPLGLSDVYNVRGPCSTGYNGFLSRTSSNASSLATSSDGEAIASSVSTSDAETTVQHFSVRRKERVTRRASLAGNTDAELEKTPTKLSRLPGRTSSCPSPAGNIRPGVQRALSLQQACSKSHTEAPSHFELEENPSFWDDHNVQVVVRARPLSGKEVAKQEISRCLRQDGAHAITWVGQPETRFTFDHVAGESISQESLFKVIGLPIVENCMAGYNSCMFAYGQTGSGKTHTMLGDITELGDGPSDNRGMTPRIFEYLFSRIQKEEQDRQLEQLRYVCKCSFLEIYNEQITDLLEPSSSNLQMREDSKKGVYVENLTEKVVTSVQDVISLLLKGAANRRVASTHMNRESSRSHSVFTCSLESKWEMNSLSNMRFGRLNLVDLAGSERQKSSGAEGDRLKEAASINKSLSTLGLVMMILVDIANGKPRHVPYRDSKLTFLLQDSLGGNSKTAIIATISPSNCCAMETLSTLKFAQRAKFIQNNAVINEDASGEMLALRREIQQLKEEVSRLRCQTISSLRRECRRDSNDFFRLSMTGKDLFDAAEKEQKNVGAELKSVELLEKIKALEGVLAGALRREQVADTATKQLSTEIEKASKLIEEQETEIKECKNLLHLQANEVDETASDSEKQAWRSQNLEVVQRLEYHRSVTKLDLENSRLTEQLQRYQTFFDAGERDMISAEIRGLRDQVLELLDGKIAVERGSLSMTIAQGDSYRKELETCRNDLTNCLEASSQLQRQVNELQTLLNQVTEDSAEKENGMKGICDQKQIQINQLETEQVLHQEKITDLKTRLQAEHEEAKTNASIQARLEQEFQASLQEIERLQAEIQELNEKQVKVAKLKEEEIKTLKTEWEAASRNLYEDLAEGERVLVELGQEMEEIMGEEWLLKSAQEKSGEKSARWSLESGKSLKGVDMEHEYFKHRTSCNTDDMFGETRTSRMKRSFGVSPRVSAMAEEKLKLEASVTQLDQELEDHKHRLEVAQKEINRMETEKLAFAKKSVIASEENEQKFHEATKRNMLALEEANRNVEMLHQKLATTHVMEEELRTEVSFLHTELECKIRSIGELDLQARTKAESYVEELRIKEVRITDLEGSFEEKCEALATLKALLASTAATSDAARKERDEAREYLQAAAILSSTQLQELRDKLDLKTTELEVLLNKFHSEATSLQQSQDELDELKIKEAGLLAEISSLKQKLSNHVSDVTREAETRRQESYVEELRIKEVRITDLEGSFEEKCEALATLEALLASAAATCDAARKERDEARAHLQAAAILSSTQLQELRDKLDLKTTELEVLLNKFHSGATSLQRSQDELDELKIKEAGLLAEILSLKQKLANHVSDVTRETETRRQEELLEKDSLLEELATAQASVLELQNTVSIAQQKSETDVQTIRQLKETVERLQTELQRKADLLYGLEFDISLLQEHAAEDTDFKQELLKANARVFELQAEVQTRGEDLKQLGSSKKHVEEQLAVKTEAMKELEDELLRSGANYALLTNESQVLSSSVSQLQTRVGNLEAELAEKSEAVSSLEKELMVTRVTATRMTMECSQQTAALASLQNEVQSLLAEKYDSKARCSSLVQKVENLEGSVTHQVDALHGEILVSMMTELCWQELNSEMKTAETTLHDEIRSLTHRLDDCQASNEALNLELVQKRRNDSSFQDELKILMTLKTEMRALFKENEDLKTEVGEYSATISSLESELTVARASAEAIDILETKTGMAEARVAEAKKIADRVSEENSVLQAQIEELQVEILSKTALVVSLERKLATVNSSLREELTSFEAQILELQTLKLALEIEVAKKSASITRKTEENDELRVYIETWQQKCYALEAQLETMKAQAAQQEEELSSLEEQLDQTQAETLKFMVNTNHNRETEEPERSEVEGVQSLLCTQASELKEQENNEEIQTLKEARDKALEEVQALLDELRRNGLLMAIHQAGALKKDGEVRKMESLVSTLQNQNGALEKQLEVLKVEAEKLRQARDGLEMELQGMKNRMTMIQAVHSTGARDIKGLQAAQEANLDLQRKLEEKETEVSELYKRMATLQNKTESQARRLDSMASELKQAHQELDELRRQRHDKDTQLSTLKELNKEAEKLTQDVMRDLRNVKLDISNYASLVSQQQVELVSERARHFDEAREKDGEISNLQTQLNQERQTWVQEMNHKQAEMVVARVLSEKMRMKNKTLSAEYKRLKADYSEKKKTLRLLEQELKELTAKSRRVSIESEADFDEVQQFQALLAQANDTMNSDCDVDFDEVEQFQALLAQANDAQRQ